MVSDFKRLIDHGEPYINVRRSSAALSGVLTHAPTELLLKEPSADSRRRYELGGACIIAVRPLPHGSCQCPDIFVL
jgi:hypothetical protein